MSRNITFVLTHHRHKLFGSYLIFICSLLFLIDLVSGDWERIP
jgi:hypothetical protein